MPRFIGRLSASASSLHSLSSVDFITNIVESSFRHTQPALRDGKVDAVVSWEPYNTAVLEQVPGSYVVQRGGGYLSYVMVATAHDPTIEKSPQIIRDFVAGLAAASQYTRENPDEAVEIFARMVPNTDVAIGKEAVRFISYDPRLSRAVMNAFSAAEDDVLKNTVHGAQRLVIADQFAPAFLAEAEKAHPEYFGDLPPLRN